MTLDAAARILQAGGNAFDAVAGALWAACVAEPLLVSVGGGGFLLARPAEGAARLYDFFTHTPGRRLPSHETDFREVLVDFGAAQQSFHIGLGSAATPGLVAGAFRFHGDLGRMPMAEVMEPALEAARRGVVVAPLQAYVARLLAPILDDTEGIRRVFRPDGRLLEDGDVHRHPELAGFLEVLAREGEDLVYRGEVAESVDRAFRAGGGHLRREDFESYRVEVRDPLEVSYRGRLVRTNPPPASGGLLIGFGLQVLGGRPPGSRPDSPAEATRIARALTAMREARREEGLDEGVDPAAVRRLLDPKTVARYRAAVELHPPGRDGTTHISILDREGNAASLTASNGEGCGWVIPGTGTMLNNMLGESDLQPGGFGRWPPDTRLTSMMAPTVMEDLEAGRILVLGSGGSNRIRSAILQVLVRVGDFGLTPEEAIAGPRLHVEGDRLEIEGGFDQEAVTALIRGWPNHGRWAERNLFFGGVHAVARGPEGTNVGGDPRRGGVAAVV